MIGLPSRFDDVAGAPRGRALWRAIDAHTTAAMTSGAILRVLASNTAIYIAGYKKKTTVMTAKIGSRMADDHAM
jgi:hypothetical protein